MNDILPTAAEIAAITDDMHRRHVAQRLIEHDRAVETGQFEFERDQELTIIRYFAAPAFTPQDIAQIVEAARADRARSDLPAPGDTAAEITDPTGVALRDQLDAILADPDDLGEWAEDVFCGPWIPTDRRCCGLLLRVLEVAEAQFLQDREGKSAESVRKAMTGDYWEWYFHLVVAVGARVAVDAQDQGVRDPVQVLNGVFNSIVATNTKTKTYTDDVIRLASEVMGALVGMDVCDPLPEVVTVADAFDYIQSMSRPAPDFRARFAELRAEMEARGIPSHTPMRELVAAGLIRWEDIRMQGTPSLAGLMASKAEE